MLQYNLLILSQVHQLTKLMLNLKIKCFSIFPLLSLKHLFINLGQILHSTFFSIDFTNSENNATRHISLKILSEPKSGWKKNIEQNSKSFLHNIIFSIKWFSFSKNGLFILSCFSLICSISQYSAMQSKSQKNFAQILLLPICMWKGSSSFWVCYLLGTSVNVDFPSEHHQRKEIFLYYLEVFWLHSPKPVQTYLQLVPHRIEWPW